MNGINRRGQKVICVASFSIHGLFGEVVPHQTPQPDHVYTVADFIDCIGASVEGQYGRMPGIDLVEVPVIILRGTNKPSGWPLVGFRPADERKTDISDLVKAAKDATIKPAIEAAASVIIPDWPKYPPGFPWT